MKIPARIKKAIETLSGYCNKHKECENCPLERFCEYGKDLMVCDWEIWEEFV